MRGRTRLCALTAAVGSAALGMYVFANSPRLERKNFRNNTVSLRGGIGVAAGTAVAAACSSQPVLGLSVGAAGVAGLLDDLDAGAHDGDTPAKGLRGHLGALSRGQVTSGFLKIVIIGAGGAVGGAALALSRRSEHTSTWKLLLDCSSSAVTIAAWANLLNLLDLRPGRALKTTVLVAAPLALSGRTSPTTAQLALGAGAVGIVAAPTDLGESTMLGDTGANALGAALGAALAAHPNMLVRAVAGGGAVALILISERVSFSKVIAQQPLLAAVDAWGRKP